MTIRSLRLRLLMAASLAILLALTAAGFGLVLLFERHVERRIGAELDIYIAQIASRARFDDAGVARIEGGLADPRFGKVYSGLYWQVVSEKTGQYLRSRSLWDTRLALPEDKPQAGVIEMHDIAGPRGASLLTHERRLAFDTPAGEQILRIAVAIDRADILALRSAFAFDVLRALALLAGVLIAAGWIQVTVGLSPLQAVRRGVAAIRDGKSARLQVEVPSEIAPLIEEVNSLLDDQDKAMQRARDRAADLAHGFKTPLTALLADAKRLRDKGHRDIAGDIARTASLMRAHIDRELTRSRIRNIKASALIEVAPIVQGLIATLKRIPQGERASFAVDIEDGLAVRIERDDLNDVLGNLLENAMRHARTQVRVRAAREGALIRFCVEDDGPGIAAEKRKLVTGRGQRFDSAGLGAGLGLAIVADVLDHYGQTLELGRSKLGGLKASFALAN